MSSYERWLWPLVFLVAVAFGAFLLHGGYAHYEGQFFLANYLDPRPLFPKIFSAHYNEWDCYQGRELSFLFGWIDAQFIRYSARAGWVHLYSITHYAGSFALAVILLRALPRLFSGLGQRDAALIVLLLLTTPAALYSGYYYRPAKILAALFLGLVLLCLAKIREQQWKASPGLLTGLALAATLMGLSDRLGIYMLLLVTMTMVIARRVDAAGAKVLIALTAALVSNALWSAIVGPWLSAVVDGYSPDTVDQVVHLRFTFLQREHYGPALLLLYDHVKYFFGNSGVLSVAVVIAALAIVLTRSSKRVAVTIGAILCATIAVYVAMYARLGSLPWPASRRVYYWLPQLVVFATGTAFVIGRLRAPRRITTPLLGLMILGNLLSIPSHRDAIRSQEHRPWILQSGSLRECIQSNERILSYRLDPAYAQLCGLLRAESKGVRWNGIPNAQPNPVLYCRHSGRPSSRP